MPVFHVEMNPGNSLAECSTGLHLGMCRLVKNPCQPDCFWFVMEVLAANVGREYMVANRFDSYPVHVTFLIGPERLSPSFVAATRFIVDVPLPQCERRERTECSAAWSAHLPRAQGAAGSNPATPIEHPANAGRNYM